MTIPVNLKNNNNDEEPQKLSSSFSAPVTKALRAAGKAIGNILFPPICIGCKCQVSHPGALCPVCWSDIRFIEQPFCPVLGTPFAHDFGSHFLCAEAIANPPPFKRLRSAVLHKGAAQRMVVSLKFYDRTDLAPWMAQWLSRAGQELLDECDVIIAVPLHRWRFWQRHYNQSAELARALAKSAGKPFCSDALIRTRNTVQQTGLGSKERQRNVDGAFKVLEKSDIHIRGRRILLIDDVYTTGATVRSATRTLLRNGAQSVDVLTFSRVLPE